jgi:hypothetical protein
MNRAEQLKDIRYGIKTVGQRIYISIDEEQKHFIGVDTFDKALLFKEEKHAKEICNSLNTRNKKYNSFRYETFKVLNPKK